MKLDRQKHGHFIQALDRTAERNPLLWLPCIIMIILALGAESAVYNISSAAERGHADKAVTKNTAPQLTKKPLVLRAAAMALAMAMPFTLLPPSFGGFGFEVSAGATIGYGRCGDMIEWILYPDGYFQMTGSGAMYDYSDITEQPWYDVSDYIQKIVISDGITSVGNHAFEGCKELLTVYFGGIFSSDNFEHIYSEGTISVLGDRAFADCTSLMSVRLPATAVKVGEGTFSGCGALRSAMIPASTESIGENAFSGCNSLTVYGSSASYTEKYAAGHNIPFIGEVVPPFTGKCGDDMYWELSADGTMVIGGTGKIFEFYSDYPWKELSYRIRKCNVLEGVTGIGAAFWNCSQLTYAIIPGSLSLIELFAFENCTALTAVTISNGTAEIDDSAFANCKELTSVEIPPSVTAIGHYAFEGCEKLIIHGTPGSYAEEYAKENKIPFVPVESSVPVTAETAESRYQLFEMPCTWPEAKVYCENLGGHLVTIGSREENDLCIELFKKSKMSLLWLGARFDEGTGKFMWVDGTDLTYTDWDIGMPDRSQVNGIREDCVMIYKNANYGVWGSSPMKWNDIFENGIYPGQEDFFYTDYYCFICEWDKHIHSYSADWRTDGTSHWHECPCGAKSGTAAHTPNIPAATETESKVCTVCGYVIEPAHGHTHSFGNEWKSDSGSHWHECICGAKSETAAHTPNIPAATETDSKVCTVCGHVIEPASGHRHSYGSEWKYNSSEHWHECVCGSKKDAGGHISGGGTVTVRPTAYTSGMMTYSCTVCGLVLRTEKIPPTGTNAYPAAPINHYPDRPSEHISPTVSVIRRPVPEEIKDDPVLEDEEILEDITEDITIALKCKLNGLTGKMARMETRKKYFGDSAIVSVANTDAAKRSAARAINNVAGGAKHNIVYPFDVSIYNAHTNKKMQLRNGGFMTFEIPVPKSMADSANEISVYRISGDDAVLLDNSLEFADGAERIRFSATAGSPYMFVVYSEKALENVGSGAGTTANPVPVDTAAPVTNGVGTPTAGLPRITGLSDKKRRFKILRKRRLDDCLLVY